MTSKPLDAAGAAVIVMLCLSWGLNQIAVKLVLPDIPPNVGIIGTLATL